MKHCTFLHSVFEIYTLFYSYNTSKFRPATFKSYHMWFVASVVDSTDLEHLFIYSFNQARYYSPGNTQNGVRPVSVLNVHTVQPGN